MDPVLDASGSIHVQYAACSVVKAFAAHLHAVAQAAQQQRQVTAAAGGSEGIVIDDSAVQVGMYQAPRAWLVASVA